MLAIRACCLLPFSAVRRKERVLNSLTITMASQGGGSKPRVSAQPKKKRKDAGPEKHGQSLGQQMEEIHEALPPKRRFSKNKNRQQQAEEVSRLSD